MKNFILSCVLWIWFISRVNSANLEDQFVGCYQNMSTVLAALQQTTLTIQWCISQCRQLTTTFSAMKNGDFCYCSDVVMNSIYAEDCLSTCRGNTTQYCGGPQSYTVYTVCPIGFYGPLCKDRCHCKNGSPCNIGNGTCFNGCEDPWSGSTCNSNTLPVISSFAYIGCFIDNSVRDLNGSSTNFVNQITQSCLSFCLNNKYLYFGTQYAYQCYCGLSYGRYGPAAESECSMLCSGGGPQNCGAAYINSIYGVLLCPNGTYGVNCSETCHCANNSGCFADGRCISGGCAVGWSGTSCNIRNCSGSVGVCIENEECAQIDLKFTSVTKCQCRRGFQRLNVWSSCTDIDECMNTGACNISTEACFNTMGGYNCKCHDGYHSENNGIPFSCYDTNECMNASACNVTSEVCINTIGSYSCNCRSGYRSDSNGIPYSCYVVTKPTSNLCEECGMTAIIVLAVILGVSLLVNITLVIDKIQARSRSQPEPRSAQTPLEKANDGVSKNDANLYEMTGENYEYATDSKPTGENREYATDLKHTGDIYECVPDSKQTDENYEYVAGAKQSDENYESVNDPKHSDENYEGITAEARQSNTYAGMYNRRTMMAP